MTDEQIIEALATKVMGWVLTNYETGDSIPEDWADAQNNDGWCWEGREGSHEAHEWNPLRNADDSKLLREKLADRFMYVVVTINSVPDKPRSYTARAWNPERWDIEKGVDAGTEQRAVALCALRSVGVEV